MPMLKLIKKNKSALFFIIIASFILAAAYLNQKNTEKEKLIPEETAQFTDKYTQRPLNHLVGEPAKLMFPEINNPEYVSNIEAKSFLRDFDEVYFAKFDKTTYVYPASMLGFHHIVNDSINNEPVAVTLCLLSDSALIYSGKIDNKALTFGVLGPLFYGNLVIYDKETDSYWYQLSGESFKGKFKEKKLTALKPLEKTQWKTIKNEDNLKVLPPVKEISFYRNFYNKYNESTIGLNTLKGKVKLDDRLPPYASGLGINIQNNYKFYPFDLIKEQKIINDILSGWNLLIVYNKKYDTYRIFRRVVGNRIYTFGIKDDALIDKETLTVWNMDGEAVKGKLKGEKLEMPIFTQVFWFSWSSFFPNTNIYINNR